MLQRWLLSWALGVIGSFLINTLLVPLLILVIILATVSALKGGGSMTFSSASSSSQTTQGTSQNWAGQVNQPVVNAALSMTPYLTTTSSDPLDQWFVAGFPQAALDYWQSDCPASSGCWIDWQNGNVQCVMFVVAAYGVAHQDLPYAHDAVVFWSDYQNVSGWQEIPNRTQNPPWPGDIIVWEDSGVGHVAIVLDVKLPHDPHDTSGYVEFGQANGPSSVERQPLTVDSAGNLTMHTWAGYDVLGYIRHSAFFS